MPKPSEVKEKREQFDKLHDLLHKGKNHEYRFDPAATSSSDMDEICMLISDAYVRLKEDGTYEID